MFGMVLSSLITPMARFYRPEVNQLARLARQSRRLARNLKVMTLIG
jgi:hypothetical protein